MSTAAEIYASRADAFNAQRVRFYGDQLQTEPAPRFAGGAGRGRQDPRRELDAGLAVIASRIQPEDVVVDVGGGAGRVALPLALRCKEVINVDLSASLADAFKAAAAEASITNVRFIQSDWMDADIEGDVVLMVNVTYFVRDVQAFIRKWAAAARKRVIIMLGTVSPRDQDAGLFKVAFGENLMPAPAFKELLPALWEMEIIPDVQVLPDAARVGVPLPQTRDEAIDWALQRLPAEPPEYAAQKISTSFNDLFVEGPQGFRPLWRPNFKELLVTWETQR